MYLYVIYAWNMKKKYLSFHAKMDVRCLCLVEERENRKGEKAWAYNFHIWVLPTRAGLLALASHLGSLLALRLRAKETRLQAPSQLLPGEPSWSPAWPCSRQAEGAGKGRESWASR